MSWYKRSSVDTLVYNIRIWLQQALNGPIDTTKLHQDLDMLMPSIDDQDALQSAINQLQSMVQMPSQQNVIDEIKLRVSNPEESIENVGDNFNENIDAMGQMHQAS